MADTIRTFVTDESHEIYGKDDYNKIQNGYPSKELKDEAWYIFEGQDHYNGIYKLTKKPADSTITAEQTNNVFGFINDYKLEKVLILHKEGTFQRWNWDFKSQFPNKYQPE